MTKPVVVEELREQDAGDHHHAPAAPDCLNCGAELQGAFCHACGQKASSQHLAMHDVAHDAMHEFLHLDGKILQTMKLLIVRPGQLTKDFIEGRRARHITPIRLYLTWSLIFFAFSTMVPAARQSFVKVDPGTKASATNAEAEKRAEEIGQSLLHSLPKVMFVLMPIFGLWNWAFFHRQQRFYVPHLYFAVHFHAFVFLVLTLGVGLSIVGPIGKGIGEALFLATIPYHFIALRRVFGGSWLAVIGKGTAVGVLYLLSTTAVLVALMISTLSAH